jgi:hypothetical protein
MVSGMIYTQLQFIHFKIGFLLSNISIPVLLPRFTAMEEVVT